MLCIQIVVLIGHSASAHDISREIATVAKEVHLSSRSKDVKVSKVDDCENMWQHSKAFFTYPQFCCFMLFFLSFLR